MTNKIQIEANIKSNKKETKRKKKRGKNFFSWDKKYFEFSLHIYTYTRFANEIKACITYK